MYPKLLRYSAVSLPLLTPSSSGSLFLGLMLNFSLVFAHGMNKPGPNGGEIRMPGPFHTEAKAEGANKLKVYLLDMNFKNPVTANSSVEVTFS